MIDTPFVAGTDTIVTFVDVAGTEVKVGVPRQGHTDPEVIAVAYRWACRQIADGKLKPWGEIRFRSIRSW